MNVKQAIEKLQEAQEKYGEDTSVFFDLPDDYAEPQFDLVGCGCSRFVVIRAVQNNDED